MDSRLKIRSPLLVGKEEGLMAQEILHSDSSFDIPLERIGEGAFSQKLKFQSKIRCPSGAKFSSQEKFLPWSDIEKWIFGAECGFQGLTT